MRVPATPHELIQEITDVICYKGKGFLFENYTCFQRVQRLLVLHLLHIMIICARVRITPAYAHPTKIEIVEEYIRN